MRERERRGGREDSLVGFPFFITELIVSFACNVVTLMYAELGSVLSPEATFRST